MAQLDSIATTMEKMLDEIRTNATALAVVKSMIDQIRQEQGDTQRTLTDRAAEERQTMQHIIELRTKLNNGITENVKMLAQRQTAMSLLLERHSLVLKIASFMSSVMVTGLVATMLKVWFE